MSIPFETIILGIFAAVIFELVVLKVLEFFLFYTIVREGTCKVFVLFGKVVHSIDEPGLHFLIPKLTWRAFVINFLGRIYTLDLRMDQRYLRSQPVNSEEGAPMGVGVWYEFVVSDPVSFLFRNADPSGSLAANINNTTVRCLSNLPLGKMLEDRHSLSQMVRTEVTAKSQEWGYHIGSVYIRKVHFRDEQMIREIESKVINRLRQVTASIKQDGDNQVHIITNSAQKTAATEIGKAAALRPLIVGQSLAEISKDPEVIKVLFDILETQKIIDHAKEILIVPKNNKTLNDMVAALNV
jgi:regulator of protease activity HflC (stomatin/prohibitin superfamily)